MAGEVLLGASVYDAVADQYPDLEARTVMLRGKEEPLTVRVLRPAAGGAGPRVA